MFLSARTAAERGDAGAAVLLGTLYLQGTGTSRDVDKAVYWYERGGPAGGWEALGNLFHNGVDMAPDYEKAAVYYTMAAGSCRVLSLYGLGALQAERRLANSDDVEGYKWLLLARWAATNTPGCGQHHGCVRDALKDKRGYRELLRNRLSPEQLAEATARAEEWRRRHPWPRGQVTCDATSAPAR